MCVIFFFSSQPGNELPNFDWADKIVKKSGHVVEYAVLSYANFRALEREKGKWLTAWLLAIIFAATDEYHQSFVPGRFPRVIDVIIFDNIGALIGVILASKKSTNSGN